MRQNLFTPHFIQAILEIANHASSHVSEIYKEYCSLAAHEAELLWVHKSDKSPLTVADTASNQIIVKALTQLTPNIPVVTEEDDKSWAFRNPQHDFWLIDPLDGTKEFISKSDEFTVNIAYVSEGKPIFGVVQAPMLDIVYWGGASMGSFFVQPSTTQQAQVLNASNIDLSHVATDTLVRVIASKSHMSVETQKLIDQFSNAQIVQAGSSLKFCKVAENKADLYPRLAPTAEWDTAAAQAVLEGAGGLVLQLNGQSLSYGKVEVLNPFFIAGPKSLVQWLQDKNLIS